MKFGELKSGEETLTPNWVYDAFSELTLASDIKVLAFLARHRLYQRSTFPTWEIAGQLGLDLRTVQASTRRLGLAGYIVSADGEHCLRGACAKPAHPLHKSTRIKTALKPLQHKKKPALEVKEVIEVKEQEQQPEREYDPWYVEQAGHSLSPGEVDFENRPGTATADGASAEAPGGASVRPALTVTATAQAPPEAEKCQATSKQKVPGAAPPDSAHAALLALFGHGFLAVLLGEAPGRAGWLSLSPERIAELHRQALSRTPGKPWRTPLISALDSESARSSPNLRLGPKPEEEYTREEWLS